MVSLSLFCALAIVSWLLVFGVRRWAGTHSMLDIPNERSLHTAPVPRGGGLVIVAVTVTGVFIFWLLHPTWPALQFLSYLAGGLVIAIVSWIDDLFSLSHIVRFAAHALGAIFCLLGIGYWHAVTLPAVGEIGLGWLGVAITFLWITGLTNAYNFMDGIDGIAGGQAIVAGLGWYFLGWVSGEELVGIIGLLLAATSLGFLVQNWSPARIFMGDVGSAFLGYTFAVLGVMAGRSDSRLALAAVLIVWPFVFDSTLTILRRLFRGDNVFLPHRAHLYQRLIIAGWGHAFVTLIYVSFGFLAVVLALAWYSGLNGSNFGLLAVLPLACLTLCLFVISQERSTGNKVSSAQVSK